MTDKYSDMDSYLLIFIPWIFLKMNSGVTGVITYTSSDDTDITNCAYGLTLVLAPRRKKACPLYTDAEPWLFPFHLLPVPCKSALFQKIVQRRSGKEEFYQLIDLVETHGQNKFRM